MRLQKIFEPHYELLSTSLSHQSRVVGLHGLAYEACGGVYNEAKIYKEFKLKIRTYLS